MGSEERELPADRPPEAEPDEPVTTGADEVPPAESEDDSAAGTDDDA